jgi:hypothetical protein
MAHPLSAGQQFDIIYFALRGTADEAASSGDSASLPGRLAPAMQEDPAWSFLPGSKMALAEQAPLPQV